MPATKQEPTLDSDEEAKEAAAVQKTWHFGFPRTLEEARPQNYEANCPPARWKVRRAQRLEATTRKVVRGWAEG